MIHRANTKQVVRTTIFKKACKCKSTASSGSFVYKYEPDGKGGFLLTYSYHPEPICNLCHTPWMQEITEGKSTST